MDSASSPAEPDQPTGSFPRQPYARGKSAGPDDEAAATQLVRILDQYLADLKTGQAPSRQQLIAQNPQFAEQLEACMAGLEFLHAAESPHPDRVQRLGDFRILREVGRGGMGAVFEAEQISLSRRVALKILRFGSVSDPEAIERFRREAETVAKLHHTNIVPIFAVGNERGVNYYAMQFIDGQSLAEVFAQHGGPLPAEKVANWGLQAAEALTHAHQRGVIHRDVKPSNLILDNEQRLWLTDFGLARRLDDVTLSLTGALLGTPRYMSPEQATAAHKHVDHRSDLFSLGATLYELLAGKPAFAGQTPHEVIQHILECKPAPIRASVPGVPRDLETIVYKCMAKERSERYESASELADDLRAFLDGRPIRARRANKIELAARWLRQQERSVKLVAAATAATVLCMLLAFASWRGYETWQQTTLKLATPTPPLVAEILGADNEVLRVETVPTQLPLVMPAGQYRMRVSGEGTLSQTFDIDLNRNEPATPSLELRDQNLLSQREVERSFALCDFQDEQALLLLGKQGITLVKRNAPVNGWSVELSPKNSPALARSPGFRWLWSSGATQYSGYGVHDLRPYIPAKAVDLNGDGTGDIVCAARHQAWVMAISGVDGKVLWFAGRAPELLAPAAKQESYQQQQVRSAVLLSPIVDQDCDGDGTADVIATFADVDLTQAMQQNAAAAHRWIEAISGKTGQSLWVYELPKDWFELPANMPIPYLMRWFCGSDGGHSGSSGGGGYYGGRHRYRQPPHFERTDPHAYRPDVQLIARDGKPALAVVAADRLALLDLATGQASGEPAELPARCARPPQWADVDGDGALELVMLDEIAPVTTSWPRTSTCELIVWSPASAKTIWSEKLDARWPEQSAWSLDVPRWPLVVDLNADGAAEIVTPDERGDLTGQISSSDIPSSKVVVFDGKSGKRSWSRRLVSLDAQVDHFVPGPDIDGDGWREIYAATIAFTKSKTFVDALSGKSGQTLWTNSQPLTNVVNSNEEFRLLEPFWWNAGDDGWPHLVVETIDVNSAGDRGRAIVGTFSAATGELAQIGTNTTSLQAADIDHDGTEDLLAFVSKAPSAYDLGGHVHAIRGVASEPWRALANVGQRVGDLDGDGIDDLVSSDGQLTARSGRSGQVIWRMSPESNFSQLNVRPARRSAAALDGRAQSFVDLDGDGAADLLAWSHQGRLGRKAPTFFAISGRSGKKMWTVDAITCIYNHGALAAEASDLDGDGRAEVIWLAAIDYGYPERLSYSTSETQLWLFVTSGQTGELKWAHELSPAYGKIPNSTMQFQVQGMSMALSVGDVNGDGMADILAPAIMPSGRQLETQAISGKDGHVLWRRPFAASPYQTPTLEGWIPPKVCDLNGDGKSEVVLTELVLNNPQNQQAASAPPVAIGIAALHGADGSTLWDWKSDIGIASWYSAAGHMRGDVLQPVVLHAQDKSLRVAALLPEAERRLAVFDAAGKVQLRKLGYINQLSWMMPADVDGTGNDSILMLDSKGVVAIDASDVEKLHWSKPLGSGNQNQMMAVLPTNFGQIVAVAADPTDNSVLGLDVATGRTKWICPGPISRTTDGTYQAMSQIALLDAPRDAAPRVLYAMAGMARCRQAAYTSSSGSEPAFAGSFAARSVAVAAPRIQVEARDERWLRDLPWHLNDDAWGRSAAIVLTALVLSLTLIVMPAAYLLKIAIRRQFSLRMQLILPVVAGLFLTVAFSRLPFSYDNPNLLQRLGIGLTMAPVVVAIGLLIRWCFSRQARRAAFWLLMTIPVSIGTAAFALTMLHFTEVVASEVSFDWSGWYPLWFFGAFMTSYFMLVALAIKAMLKMTHERIRKSRVIVLPSNEAAATVLQPTIATGQNVEFESQR